MHHDRDPAHWPEPMPQEGGLPPLSMDQLQLLAQMAQAMAAMSAQPMPKPASHTGSVSVARTAAGPRDHRPAGPGR